MVTQCLLLPTGTHHGCTTHTVSLRGGGDPSRSYAVSAPADRDASQLDYSYRIIKGGVGLRNMLRWPWVTLAETRRGGGGEILAVVTQSDLSRRLRIMAGGGGGGGGVTQYAPVAMGDTSRDTQGGGGDPSRSYAERS